jgi:hypothetical protein
MEVAMLQRNGQVCKILLRQLEHFLILIQTENAAAWQDTLDEKSRMPTGPDGCVNQEVSGGRRKILQYGRRENRYMIWHSV